METEKKFSRREFTEAVVTSITTGALALTLLKDAGAREQRTLEEVYGSEIKDLQLSQSRKSDLARMQEELEKSLQKPLSDRKWIMVIDLRKCVGCNACTIACIAENRTPPGIVYRPVLDWETGEYPMVSRAFLPKPCFHCDHPPCVPVCPVNATWKREDGIVVIDYNKCIGCRYCVIACPYGARATDFGFDWTPVNEEPNSSPLVNRDGKERLDNLPTLEYQPTEWFRDRWRRGDIVGVTRKCHFCVHRIESGLLPACVTTCIGGATYFGDANNPNSLVRELLRENKAIRLKEELGTEPSVFYIVGRAAGGSDIEVSEVEEKVEEFRSMLLERELRIPEGVRLR